MARVSLSLCLLTFLCMFACSTSEEDYIWGGQKQGKTWCVAQVSAPNDKLQRFLDECCSQLDCGPIKPGGPCYEPNTYRNHGSYALDLWFRVRGECRSDIGTPAVTDPSWGPCKYP
ncbi:unnamed protein product [Ilex paraguariensis]|uniref:X8 domain-containing protein n=1 Tax=Ilex paraguariensis TaxID=185542 RepID=A0ABC8R0S7_9AQUA